MPLSIEPKNSVKTQSGLVFGRHLLTLVSGTVAAQLIAVAAIPLLTRLYTPADFALLASYVGLVSLFGVIIAGRYEMAIMHASSPLEADRLVTTALSVTFTLTLVIGLTFAIFSSQISHLLGLPELQNWLQWFAFPIFAMGSIQIFSTRLNWQKKYTGIATGKVIQNASSAGISLVLGLQKTAGGGLLLGHILGLCFATIFFWRKSKFEFHFVSAEVFTLVKKYKHFPMFSAPAALLDVAAMYACIFIIGKFYSSYELGQFSLTHRLLLLPMVLVGTAVSQIFFKQATECYREKGSLRLLFNTTFKKILLLSLPFFVFLIIFSPQLFALVFGDTWRTAGEYTRLVAIAYWIRLAVSPISTIFIVTHKLKTGTLWQAGYFFTSYSILSIGAASGLSITQFLILYAVHEVLLYLLLVWFAFKVIDSTN